MFSQSTNPYLPYPSHGFTLVEVIVVLTITAILFLIAGSIAFNTFPKNAVQVETGAVTDILRRAQSRSVSGFQDSVWGVHFTQNEFTLFAGSTYETRNQQFDETHPIASAVSLSGITDVIFQFSTGETSNAGNVILTSTATGETVTLQINERGRIQKL
jgi:prepilin-type N-terminal cleavage/methylation domain-containing protein